MMKERKGERSKREDRSQESEKQKVKARVLSRKARIGRIIVNLFSAGDKE